MQVIKSIKFFNYAIVFIIVAVLIIYGFFCKAAKDEVFFLCSNFNFGVNQADVIRQLKTANLSSYVTSNNQDGRTIVFSSDVNFSLYKCLINIDNNGKVIDALFL